MSYREIRRSCKSCGRETLHWRPRLDLHPARPEPRRSAVAALLPVAALIRTLLGSEAGDWRCLECDHPWDVSLLRR